MIEVKVIAKKINKNPEIEQSIHYNQITNTEICMVIAEIEKIKLELLDMIEYSFEVDDNGQA